MSPIIKKRIEQLKNSMLLIEQTTIVLNDLAQCYNEPNKTAKSFAMSSDLGRFVSLGYRRIKSGARRPANQKELLMVAAIDNRCPLSARRIIDYLE